MKQQRSVLYNIPPIGVGTMEVESLTSYIARIADAHCVETGTLVNEILITELKKEGIYKEKSIFAVYKNTTSKFNGLSVAAIKNAKILNKLCGRDNLENLTLIKYKNILTDTRLLKANKSWCPYCVADMKGTLYEKLIWSISLVDTCHIHNVKLVDTCKNCGAKQKHLKFKTLNGFCQKCFEWFGNNNIEKCKKDSTNFQNIFFIGSMLEKTKDNHILTNKHFVKNLICLWDLIPSPKREFQEKNIGISGKLITDLRRGFTDKISLRDLIRICTFLNCSPNDLLGRLIDISFESFKTNKKLQMNNKRKKFDNVKLERMLIEYISLCKEDEKNYMNMKGLEKKTGHSTSTMIKYFPELFEDIKKLNTESREKLKIQKHKDRLELIRQVTINLHNSGIYPGLKKVQRTLPFVITGFEKEYRDTWEATIIELGVIKRVNQFD